MRIILCILVSSAVTSNPLTELILEVFSNLNDSMILWIAVLHLVSK